MWHIRRTTLQSLCTYILCQNKGRTHNNSKHFSCIYQLKSMKFHLTKYGRSYPKWLTQFLLLIKRCTPINEYYIKYIVNSLYISCRRERFDNTIFTSIVIRFCSFSFSTSIQLFRMNSSPNQLIISCIFSQHFISTVL